MMTASSVTKKFDCIVCNNDDNKFDDNGFKCDDDDDSQGIRSPRSLSPGPIDGTNDQTDPNH